MMKESELAGMTVNERLFAFDLFAEFDQAAKTRNKNELIKILMRAKFSKQVAVETTEALLLNPAKYGY